MGTQYAVLGATMTCSMGAETPAICLPPGHGTYIVKQGLLVDSDNKPGTNIPPFGFCKVLKAQCAYAPAGKWDGVQKNYLLNGEPVVKKTSVLTCGIGGTIK